MDCPLDYIPDRLHTNDRQPINEFGLHELLFRRCKLEEKENPFAKISLVDLSVNRQGEIGEELCKPDDVLFNTHPEEGHIQARFDDQVIVVLEILEIAPSNTYEKLFEEDANNCRIILRHRPDPCNFSHSAFEIFYNQTEVTYENWKNTLGKNNKLRTKCRQEMAKMILREEVRINWEDENKAA